MESLIFVGTQRWVKQWTTIFQIGRKRYVSFWSLLQSFSSQSLHYWSNTIYSSWITIALTVTTNYRECLQANQKHRWRTSAHWLTRLHIQHGTSAIKWSLIKQSLRLQATLKACDYRISVSFWLQNVDCKLQLMKSGWIFLFRKQDFRNWSVKKNMSKIYGKKMRTRRAPFQTDGYQ